MTGGMETKGRQMRCADCYWLDWDFVTHQHITPREGYHYCGLHGSARVDPEGEQRNLDRHGGCGFTPVQEPIQLVLDF